MALPSAADFSSLASAISTLNTTMVARSNTGNTSSRPTAGQTSVMQSIKTAVTTMTKLTTGLEKLSASLEKTQRQFGVDIGSAAKLQIDGLEASIQSYINSIKSGFTARAVSGREISGARDSYQNEFGGILTADAAADLATQARTMGVTAEQLTKARRVFTTQSLGNVTEAKKAQDKFIGEFTKKGLTGKEAMQEIAKNSELLARNGTRFAGQMARALIDAKKIGVDLSKVSQFGDSLINDFEGFLEGTANLGAMGFNLDSNRLAQISETGSDADLYNELKSQLASTGKDITKLRRSERLELESMFGMSISDMQKMAGETPEGDTKSPEELQTEANTLLSRIATAIDTFAPALGLVTSAIGVLGNLWMARVLRQLQINSAAGSGTASSAVGGGLRLRGRTRLARSRVRRSARTAGRRIGGLIPTRIFNAFGLALESITFQFSRLANGIRTSRIGQLTGSVSNVARRGLSRVGGLMGKTGLLAGVFGGVEGFMSAKKQGKGTAESAGIGTVQGVSAAGGVALGTALGTALAPFTLGISAVIGPLLGGVLGNTFGKAINKWFPEFGSILGDTFKSIGSSMQPLMESFKQLWSTIKEFGGSMSSMVGPILIPSLKAVGFVLGVTLVGAFKLLEYTLKPLIFILKLGVDAITAVMSGFTRLYNWIGSGISTVTNKLSEIPLVGKLFKKGDDVVSQPGYGKRSLVTPSGVIALNNKDNIIAYADDLDGTKKLPYGSIAKKAVEKYEQLDAFKKQVNDVFAQLISPSGGFGKVSKFINTDLNKPIGGKIGGAVAKAQELKAGGAGGLLSMAQNKFGDMFGGKAGGAMSSISNLFTGGGSTTSNLMGMATKIPGVGGLLGKATGLLSGGGLKGMAGSLLGKVGLGGIGGNLLGGLAGGPMGMLGMAAPLLKKIPFVGSAFGKLADAPNKLMGKLAGSALGKIGGLFGKKKAPAVSAMGAMVPEMGNMMSMLPFLSGAQSTAEQSTSRTQTPISVDTTGIERQLNNFINALQNIQVNMDGTKVGKLLVASNDAASSIGVFREQSR